FQTPGIPQLLELDCGTHCLLAIFNWSDGSAQVGALLPPGRWHAFELWDREYLGVYKGAVTLPVPPHGCRLLRLTPELRRPRSVASTLHITMGVMDIGGEQWDGEKLRVRLRPVARKNGELFVLRDGRISVIGVERRTSDRTIEA